MKRYWGILCLLGLLLVLAPLAAQEEVYYPTTEWRISTPEEQGMDSAQLLAALEYVQDDDLAIDSITVIRHGYVVLDAYLYPNMPGTKRWVHSVTKSFIATLTGIAVDQGLIRGIDQPMLELFPNRNIANLDERKQTLTVGNLLTMSSGFSCNDTGTVILSTMLEASNALQYLLDQPVPSFEPGKAFAYCNPNSDLLAGAIEELADMPLRDYADRYLFTPLGIQDYDWLTNQNGLPFGHTGLQLTAQDMARLGYLYLHRGQWADTQIVSADWVDLVTCADPALCPFYDLFGSVGYGYHWLMFPSLFYAASGANGQLIAVVPELDMVIVLTSSGVTTIQTLDVVAFDLIVNRILSAAQSESPLPVDSEAQAALEARVAALANPEPAQVPPLPDTVTRISGQIYDLRRPLYLDLGPPNIAEYFVGRTLELTAFALSFEQDAEARLSLYFADGYQADFPVGLDGVWRMTASEFGPVAGMGEWQSRGTKFVTQFSFITFSNRNGLDFTFGANHVSVRWTDVGAGASRSINALPREQ